MFPAKPTHSDMNGTFANGVLLLLIAVPVLSVTLLWLMHPGIFGIRAHTLVMRPPTPDGSLRQPVNTTAKAQQLLKFESELRKKAYQNSRIQTGPDFFNDSDMIAPYHLVVVYHAGSNTPLLSARCFNHLPTIEHQLRGQNFDPNDSDHAANLVWSSAHAGPATLADRLSGNTSSKLYRQHRNFIFLVLYAEIFRQSRGRLLVLMARSEGREKLLNNYRKLGFELRGSTHHKGKKHWVLVTRPTFKLFYAQLKPMPTLALCFNRLMQLFSA